MNPDKPEPSRARVTASRNLSAYHRGASESGASFAMSLCSAGLILTAWSGPAIRIGPAECDEDKPRVGGREAGGGAEPVQTIPRLLGLAREGNCGGDDAVVKPPLVLFAGIRNDARQDLKRLEGGHEDRQVNENRSRLAVPRNVALLGQQLRHGATPSRLRHGSQRVVDFLQVMRKIGLPANSQFERHKRPSTHVVFEITIQGRLQPRLDRFLRRPVRIERLAFLNRSHSHALDEVNRRITRKLGVWRRDRRPTFHRASERHRRGRHPGPCQVPRRRYQAGRIRTARSPAERFPEYPSLPVQDSHPRTVRHDRGHADRQCTPKRDWNVHAARPAKP